MPPHLKERLRLLVGISLVLAALAIEVASRDELFLLASAVAGLGVATLLAPTIAAWGDEVLPDPPWRREFRLPRRRGGDGP